MSFGKTKETKSVSAPVFSETWLPGQKEYIPEFAKVWKDIFAGNLESPAAKMLQQITGEAAMKETAQQRRSIAGTKGMTAPAKAKAMSTLGGTAVSAMAKVPQDIWGSAKEFLSAYSLTPPTVSSGTVSKSSGGGGFNVGLCWVWTFFDGKNGRSTNLVREYRDSHFGRDSDVDLGYKAIGKIIRPLLRFWLIRKLTFWTIYFPITKIAEGERNSLLMLVGHFWMQIFKTIGRLERQYGLCLRVAR